MKILALDTSMTACSAALWHDNGVRASRHKSMARGQSEVIIGMVGEIMDQGECTFSDLDLLAVTLGPGSFTGIRTGLATARGMALAGDLPCLGVTTLETVAYGLEEGQRRAMTVLVVLDSKRDDVYAQAFDDRLEPLTDACCVAIGSIVEMLPPTPVVVIGDASGRVVESLTKSSIDVTIGTASEVPDAAVLADIAARRWRPGDKPAPPTPFYLRPPDVSLPKKQSLDLYR